MNKDVFLFAPSSSIFSHLNQQTNDVMFNTTINCYHFDWVSFSINFGFLVGGKTQQREISTHQLHLQMEKICLIWSIIPVLPGVMSTTTIPLLRLLLPGFSGWGRISRQVAHQIQSFPKLCPEEKPQAK